MTRLSKIFGSCWQISTQCSKVNLLLNASTAISSNTCKPGALRVLGKIPRKRTYFCSKTYSLPQKDVAQILAQMSAGGDTLTGNFKPDIVFVLGGPGAGKGTQCSLIVKNFGYVHLSAGDLLREERKTPNSKVGELIESCITEGKIVPVEITCGLLEKAMVKSGAKKFLIDGFPRNDDNLSGWNKQMSAKVNLKFVLFFDCPEKVCTERCLSRGAAGSGRSDDNAESLKKRFDTYINSTMPVIEHYEAQNLVRKVDASKQPEEVFDEVKKLFSD